LTGAGTGRPFAVGRRSRTTVFRCADVGSSTSCRACAAGTTFQYGTSAARGVGSAIRYRVHFPSVVTAVAPCGGGLADRWMIHSIANRSRTFVASDWKVAEL